jgi:SAM-dependent methyltransferase
MSSNWQTAFFRGVALDFWRLAATPEMTADDVRFLQRTLPINPGARLLDVPCGNGRHAIELAKLGCHGTGVDSSEEFIAEARAAPVDAEWILGDMCDLPWSNTLDGAYCFGNSFCYLDHHGATQFLAAIGRCLKPGGRFAIAFTGQKGTVRRRIVAIVILVGRVVVFRPRHMPAEELERGYGWIYRRLFSHASIWRRCPEDWRAAAPYLAMSYLYKRSNRFWHFLIAHDLVHTVWRPLVEFTRRRHLLFRQRLAETPAASGAAGCVVSAGV